MAFAVARRLCYLKIDLDKILNNTRKLKAKCAEHTGTYFCVFCHLDIVNVELFFFKLLKMNFFDIVLIFAQNIYCGYTSIHSLCFGAKIRKIDIPLHTQVLRYKSGVQGGVHFTDMFS